ncbi:hypothetical protein DYB36_012487 [Aphanomyces astaci]|uniref:Uncharacterized protein n=1 Tax=Aphanomyces astaci TaxID=112090 RepID=A0A397BC08_APHAT|nr:hypothetical protein DYB36_012487 [Aphanomyces astaci]
MREYQKYLEQVNALQCNGSRPFAMPVSVCMDPFSKRQIALYDFNRDHNSITNDEWVAWFKSAFEEDPQELDVLKQRLQRAIRFDTESWTRTVHKQLQLQRNKVLKSDVFRYVNWLRIFAAGHQLYVGLGDESTPSPAAKPVEAARGGKRQVPRREGSREDAAQNNGSVGGRCDRAQYC